MDHKIGNMMLENPSDNLIWLKGRAQNIRYEAKDPEML